MVKSRPSSNLENYSEHDLKVFAEFENNQPSLKRKKLRHLTSFAVDPEQTQAVDDAFSMDLTSNIIYVHIADPSGFIQEKMKTEKFRNANAQSEMHKSHRKTGHIFPFYFMKTYLSLDAECFGETNVEALTICFQISSNGVITKSSIEIFPSMIKKPIRLSLAKANEYIKDKKYLELTKLQETLSVISSVRKVRCTESYSNMSSKRCNALGKAEENAQQMVQEIMVAANSAVAIYARERGINLFFSTMEPGKKKKFSSKCGKHASMGVEEYAGVTSPLRIPIHLFNQFQLRSRLRNIENGIKDPEKKYSSFSKWISNKFNIPALDSL